MKPTLENIDHWLFDALEGNLSPTQEQALEDFIAQNPELELEQQAWLKTNYAASELTFEPKAVLYRKKKFGYKPYAAAAILLLLLATKSFLSNQTSPSLSSPSTKHHFPTTEQSKTCLLYTSPSPRDES
jgi:hypothetical protein